MSQISTEPVDQFYKRKSTPNNFFYSISYTNSSEKKQSNSNSLFFNNNSQTISPDPKKKKLLTNIYYDTDINQYIENTSIINYDVNRNSKNYPKIILEKEQTKQTKVKLSNYCLCGDGLGLFNNQITIDKTGCFDLEIKEDKDNYSEYTYKIRSKNHQIKESNSLPLIRKKEVDNINRKNNNISNPSKSFEYINNKYDNSIKKRNNKENYKENSNAIYPNNNYSFSYKDISLGTIKNRTFKDKKKNFRRKFS